MADLKLITLCLVLVNFFTVANTIKRPNVLIAISDDQSYPHASVYGDPLIKTPNLQRVANQGVIFNNAFTPVPGCSPMRAAFLTGRYIWQIEQAGTHASSFPLKYVTFQEQLQKSGYFTGYTGKGWSPGNWKIDGRQHNPAGPVFSDIKLVPPQGISPFDYASNFDAFLKQKPKDKPFSFWYGAKEPHRSYKKGIGAEHGLDPKLAKVPPFLPDTMEIRSDLTDYGYEIQWFDQHLGRILDSLEKAGELENTLVIVTSDNGMPFPRAKANLYEYGIHLPLVVSWPKGFSGKRTIDDLVNLIDVTATIYQATGVKPPKQFPPSGKSLMNILTSSEQGVVDSSRDAIYCGRERHSSSRFNSLGYPQRCIRTADFLYIKNYKHERWPAGDPHSFKAPNQVIKKSPDDNPKGFHDIDGGPTKNYLIANRHDPKVKPFYLLATAKRPTEELYDIKKDPGCLNNLAQGKQHQKIKNTLAMQLYAFLKDTGDARVLAQDGGHIWETYPRYSGLRWFAQPNWVEDDKVSAQPENWLLQRINSQAKNKKAK